MEDKKQHQDEVQYLFEQYVSGKATKEQTTAFYRLVQDPHYQPVLLSLMDGYFNQVSKKGGLDAAQKERALGVVFQQQRRSETQSKLKVTFRNPYFWTKAVAIVLLFIMILAFPYYSSRHQAHPTVHYSPYKGVIPPGGNKAILTLADGTQLALTDAVSGTIANQATCQIDQLTNGQIMYKVAMASGNRSLTIPYNTITVPSGGQYRVVLSDGTKVWLNAASSLKYPVTFDSLASRTVQLTGEAYFEVSKMLRGHKKVPFIVKSAGQQVKVLGTHFNINAYKGAKMTTTTLIEGKVMVRRPGSFEKVLWPGQQAKVTAQIHIKKVDTSLAVAWKNGLFKFKNANIKTVMDQFAKWYDLDVSYQGEIPKNRFNGEIYRNMSATSALEILRLAHIKFSVLAPSTNEGRKKIVIY